LFPSSPIARLRRWDWWKAKKRMLLSKHPTWW